MPTVSEDRLAVLLQPYLSDLPESVTVPAEMYGQLGVYLDMLVRWNARTNLTAIREPEEIVGRHFGESLFAGGVLARYLGDGRDVLDFGSGAGFPGVPVQVLLPELRVTLAESQGKKAAFLREVVRVLDLGSEVWAGRVEAIAEERRFDAVMLRAVDRMEDMVQAGRARVKAGGALLEMIGATRGDGEIFSVPDRAGSVVRVSRVR